MFLGNQLSRFHVVFISNSHFWVSLSFSLPNYCRFNSSSLLSVFIVLHDLFNSYSFLFSLPLVVFSCGRCHIYCLISFPLRRIYCRSFLFVVHVPCICCRFQVLSWSYCFMAFWQHYCRFLLNFVIFCRFPVVVAAFIVNFFWLLHLSSSALSLLGYSPSLVNFCPSQA